MTPVNWWRKRKAKAAAKRAQEEMLTEIIRAAIDRELSLLGLDGEN